MQEAISRHKMKVIDDVAIRCQCLGPYSGSSRRKISRAHFGEQLLRRLHKRDIH